MDRECEELAKQIKESIKQVIEQNITGININECEQENFINLMKKPQDREKYSADFSLLKLSELKDEIFDYFKYLLGHFRADPSDPYVVKALSDIYTFPRESYLENIGLRQPEIVFKEGSISFVNLNENMVEDFVRRLAKRAQENREAFVEGVNYNRRTKSDYPKSQETIGLSNKSKILFIGEKGIGKTIFLNYFLTVWNRDFEENRVIWVRIDFVRRGMPFNNLNKWLQWKTCNIVYKFYDQETNDKKLVFDLSYENEELIKFIESEKKGPIRREEYEDYKREITKGHFFEIKQFYFQGLYNYLCIKKGIGFIFILDGMDKLDATELETNKYKKRMEKVRELITDRKIMGCYIISMREETIAEFMPGENHLNNYPLIKIVESHPADIYSNRLLYLMKSKMPQKIKKIFHDRSEEHIRLILHDIYLEFIRLISYSCLRDLKNKGVFDVDEGLEVYLDFFDNDYRKASDALIIILEYFLANLKDDLEKNFLDIIEKKWRDEYLSEQEKNNYISDKLKLLNNYIRQKKIRKKRKNVFKKHYLIIEALMLGGKGYSFPKYFYKRINQKLERFENFEGRKVMIPNLFYLPRLITEKERINLLCGVRLLQLLDSYTSLRIKKIIEYMKNYFKYEPQLIKDLIEVYQSQRLIEYVKTPCDISNEDYQISKKGKFFIKNMIKRLDYLNLARQSAFLPVDLLSQGLFPNTMPIHKTKYIFFKIKGTVNFLRLISSIEKQEKDSYPGTFTTYSGKPLEISPIIIGDVMEDIEKIIDRAAITRQYRLFKMLRDEYIDKSFQT